jgi:pimeloyl-ACP methyl ester carboxylesterase
MDALKIEKPVIGAFDWGARTANIIAALWPERCRNLMASRVISPYFTRVNRPKR